MQKSDVVGYARYLGSIAGSFAVIALSFALILDAPGDLSEAKAGSITPTVAALTQEPAKAPKPVRQFTASDFDISRTVAVNVRGTDQQQASLAAPAAAAPSGLSATVVAEAVNLRASASKSSSRISVVNAGTAVTVLETRRSWSRITTDDGRTGWLASRFLN